MKSVVENPMEIAAIAGLSEGQTLTESDGQLAAMAKEGDRAAFHQLLQKHYDTIHRAAYRYTGHVEDAEDIAQEVCVGLAHKIKTYRGEASFRTWLYTLVVNACRDHHRKHRSNRTKELAYCELENHERAINAENARRVAWLYREIAQLKTPLRETALLVLAEDLSHAEVGQVLGCSESTVSWRMHEIRKLLKARREDSRE